MLTPQAQVCCRHHFPRARPQTTHLGETSPWATNTKPEPQAGEQAAAKMDGDQEGEHSRCDQQRREQLAY